MTKFMINNRTDAQKNWRQFEYTILNTNKYTLEWFKICFMKNLTDWIKIFRWFMFKMVYVDIFLGGKNYEGTSIKI